MHYDWKSLVNACECFYKKHALLRMTERDVDFGDIERAVNDPELIREYPDDTPLPSCLMLGHDKKGKPLHLIWAYDEESQAMHLITAYRPDSEKWTADFKERLDR